MEPLADLPDLSTLEWRDGRASYPISHKNYDDLRCPWMRPMVLVMLEVPRQEARWMEFGPERLVIRRCA